MNIRQAILAAANQIEQHPDTFDFISTRIPGCGTPGCALGWIGYFLGMKGTFSAPTVAMGLPKEGLFSEDYGEKYREFAFYKRMNAICENGKWRDDAQICADTLRKYADKYHPNLGTDIPKQGIPDSVRSIFREQGAVT